MGGVDKGLQLFQGVPLALHALQRLRPQVDRLMINANRHLAQYREFGVPVVADVLPDYAGPLAGFVTALQRCETAYLVTVPCDSPLFPLDLVDRLARALAGSDNEIAMATAPEPGRDGKPLWRTQPVFCLLPRRLLGSLTEYLSGGGRKIDAWTARHRTVQVAFDDAGAFANANTLAELQALQP